MRNAYIPPEHLTEIRRRLNRVDREITDILIDTGFRLDDIMHLRRWQLWQPELTIRERKTGHIRTVPFSHTHIASWKERPHSGALSYAFPALRAGGRNKMHRTTYWRHFLAAVKAAGYADRGYSPHSLRKVYAVNLLKRSGSIQSVQRDLGHTNISTTVIYALADVLARDSA